MSRPREHVHGLCPLQEIAAGGEALDVAGERGGIAGDVGEGGNARADECVEKLFVRAFAGRIQNGRVEMLAMGDELRNFRRRVAQNEARAVGQTVAMAGGTISTPITCAAR